MYKLAMSNLEGASVVYIFLTDYMGNQYTLGGITSNICGFYRNDLVKGMSKARYPVSHNTFKEYTLPHKMLEDLLIHLTIVDDSTELREVIKYVTEAIDMYSPKPLIFKEGQ